jgi:glycosyltransferase involved in cell wall biosynthesis
MPEFPRVLQVSPTYFATESVIGGAERYVQGLATALSEKASTTLISFGPRSSEERIANLRFKCYRPWSWVRGNKSNPLELTFLAELARHDVVHCHQAYTLVTEAVLVAAFVLRKPVFLTNLGGGGWTLLSRFGIQRRAAGNLAVSRYALERSRIPGVEGAVVYGGIDLARIGPASAAEGRGYRIVSVGRLLPHKGFHHLIRAVRDSELELIIAGAATDRSYASFLQGESRGRLTILEDRSDREVVELLRSAAVAVFPSTRIGPHGERLSGEPELFGQAPLEAMACGTPTLLSDVGSYPEIALPSNEETVFRDGDTAGLRDLIDHLLLNPQRMAELGKLGRSHVENRFTWSRVAAACLEAYASALRSRW